MKSKELFFLYRGSCRTTPCNLLACNRGSLHKALRLNCIPNKSETSKSLFCVSDIRGIRRSTGVVVPGTLPPRFIRSRRLHASPSNSHVFSDFSSYRPLPEYQLRIFMEGGARANVAGRGALKIASVSSQHWWLFRVLDEHTSFSSAIIRTWHRSFFEPTREPELLWIASSY